MKLEYQIGDPVRLTDIKVRKLTNPRLGILFYMSAQI